MKTLNRSSGSARCRHEPIRSVLRGCLTLAMLLQPGTARTQTLARPGWVGSGMTVERWWTHAVLCEMKPDSLAAGSATGSAAGGGSALHRLASRLDDLQTLGVDAVLLRGLEADVQNGAIEVRKVAGAKVQIDERYGTMEEFDEFVTDAVRHGMRVLVGLGRGARGTELTEDARFWLNHGATGLSLASDDAAEIRAIRGVLRGYVGERVLIGAGPASAEMDVPAERARGRSATRDGTVSGGLRSDEPDLLQIALPSVAQGAAAMRSGIERARAMADTSASVPLLSAEVSGGESAASRVVATALLGSGGAVLLHVDDLDLAHAESNSTQNSIFNWYRQWSGLHRGRAAMRSGNDTLLDHDAEGALVWVRQLRGGSLPVVAICNVTDKRLRLSLVNDMQKLKLHGSFLRTISRSDGGMGAMPLRQVDLPGFGVYVGELSR